MRLFQASSRMLVVSVLLLVVGVLALAPSAERVQAQEGVVPSELVLAMIPSREPDILLPDLQPFGDLLGEALRERGFAIDTVTAVVLTSEQATVSALGTGEVHVGFMGPLSAVRAERESGAEIVTASVRFGNLKFKGQLMTRHNETNYANIQNLVTDVQNGESVTMSYTSPGSTSGFLFPCLKLKQLGILPGEFSNFQTFFAGGHSSSFRAVWNGDANVGWGFDDVRTGFITRPDDTGLDPLDEAAGRTEFDVFNEITAEVSLIGFTDFVPNDPQVVAGNLAPDLKEAIKAELASLSRGAGSDFIFNLVDATEFVPVSEDGQLTNADFDVIRAAIEEVEPIIAQCSNQ